MDVTNQTIQVAMVADDGQCVSMHSPGNIEEYENGKKYGNLTAVFLTSAASIDFTFARKYWKDGKWQDRVARPSDYHEWKNYEWKINSTLFWQHVRMERDTRLALTDPYVLSDFPIATDKLAEWNTYRAKLRSVPADNSSATSMDQIVWPTKPS